MAITDTSTAPCTMQIPVSDRDFGYAQHVLPHQMKVVGKHADDVVFSVNRFEKPDNPELLDALLDSLSTQFDNVRVVEVDYSANARRWVSNTFFGGAGYPMYDFKGIPIHAFLEQLRQSRHPHLFHCACDLMFGGSGPWFKEAIDVIESDQDVLAVNPLAGPRHSGPYHSDGIPYSTATGEGFKVQGFTSRSHLVKLERFYKTMSGLPELRPKRRNDRIFTRLAGYPMVDHLEILCQENMLAHKQFRVDMNGSGNLWNLHPVYKTPQFVTGVTGLIERVESGDVSTEQLGLYDLHASMLVQTDIPGKKSLLKRLLALGKGRVLSRRGPSDLRSDSLT